MNAWHFIAGAYLVTLIVMIVEVLVVRAAHRAALESARDGGPGPRQDPHDDEKPA